MCFRHTLMHFLQKCTTKLYDIAPPLSNIFGINKKKTTPAAIQYRASSTCLTKYTIQIANIKSGFFWFADSLYRAISLQFCLPVLTVRVVFCEHCANLSFFQHFTTYKNHEICHINRVALTKYNIPLQSEVYAKLGPTFFLSL